MTIAPPDDPHQPPSPAVPTGPTSRAALEEAAGLLASRGRMREAIALVEQALFAKPKDPDTLLLLTLLLLGTGSTRDRHFGMGYLRRVQWRAPSPPRAD